MKNVPQISDAEWQVMKILWEDSPLTAMEVIGRLENSTNWKPKTVKTLLRRLSDKNAISYTIENRAYFYCPIVRESDCVKAETESFLKRVYNGSFNMLVQNFVEE
jgi:BlaI family transcriptional regulator, penicillinase repressor